MRSAAEIDLFQQQLQAYKSFASFQAAVFESDQHPVILEGLRSVCWRIFLLFRDFDQSQWLASLGKSRSAYESLRTHYLRAIQNPDEIESAADPLNDNVESPWTALRQDEAMRQEIYQDVERCMPENTYFRQPETQNMLLDILFVYTKLNPDVGYRQGMHELLAPILWVVERDSNESEDAGQALYEVLDARYVEHDTFTLFAEVMKTAKSFYDPAGVGNQNAARTAQRLVENESAMLVRCRRIFSDLLPQYDPGLATHLEELDISPQLFLMRWTRLLFGREFPFNDTLQVWDLLFAEDPSLELIDYICVAMILRIRWQLIDADTNEALMLLMRYPTTAENYPPRTFVLDARYLRSNRDIESGNDLIKKYSDRVPPPFRRQPHRPSTPEYSASPSSHRSRSPFISPGVPSAFESLINDAARGVINRGEKWGFNQAVRDAVGEVRKNVQNLQAGRGSPRAQLGGLGHRSNRSSEISGNIAANVLRKMTALEQRNRELAKMLETAVTDLWSCEKEVGEKKAMSEDSLQAFSMAVAKVQFVQVFLQDSTLPLPQEEDKKPAEIEQPTQEQNAASAAQSEQGVAEQTTESTSSRPEPGTENTPSLAPSPLPIIVRPMSTSSPPPSLPTTSVSAHHASATVPSMAKQPFQAPAESQGNAARPRIEQSNYSWMLGQAHENSSDFVRASPFAPSERRQQARHGKNEKSFLFGEDDDVVGERRVVKGRARKGSRDVRKGGSSGSPAPEHEDIGLDEVKREGEDAEPI